jgi:MFS family permease
VTEPTVRARGAAFTAFETPAFTRFYIGTLVSQLGFWSSHISYQDLMSDLTSDELWVSLLFVFAFGPVLFVGPIGGILVDRLDRKKVILAGYASTMVTAAVQVAIVATDNETPALLLVTALGVGTTMAIMGPAMQAATANVVPSHQLASAISLQSLGANLSRIVGPALVAPIIAAGLFEVSWGAYFVASGIALMLMSGVDLSSQERDRSKVGFREQLVSGIRHARDRQPALAALSLVAVVTIFGVSHISLLPAFTADALDHDKGDFVWLGVATGAGALLGALAAGTLAAGATLRRGAALAVPYCALLLVFSRISTFEIALAIQVVAGFFYIASFTTLQVLVQQLVDDRLRGRVMSLFQIAWGGCVPIGALVMGLLAGAGGLDLGSADTIALTSTVAMIWAASIAVAAPRWRSAPPDPAVAPVGS